MVIKGNRPDVNELIKAAISIWRNEGKDAIDGNSDFFNLQNDPVTRLLIGAIAHQSGLISEDIEGFRQDVVEELLNLAAPEYLFQSIPAVGFMQTVKAKRVGMSNEDSTRLDETVSFTVTQDGQEKREKYSFMPIVEITVFDLKVQTISPIGKNKWRIELAENEPISNLSGLSFFLPRIKGCSRIKLTSGNVEMDCCCLSDFERLPYVATFMAGMGHSKSASQLATLQNLYDRICLCANNYCIINESIPSGQIARHDGCIVLEMELEGVDNNIGLRPEDILLNCFPVSNVGIHSTSLSQESPLQRLNPSDGEFVTLVTDTDSIAKEDSVVVRHVGTSRMTPVVWMQRMKRLLDYYDSEYNMVRNAIDAKYDSVMQQFVAALRETVKGGLPNDEATYLVLKDRLVPSITAKWLTSSGSKVNDLNPTHKIQPSTAQLDAEQTRFVVLPQGGRDIVSNREERHNAIQYHVQSRGKIVSKSDIVAFCRYVLGDVFAIKSDSIESIRIKPIIQNTAEAFYERVLLVEIQLRGDFQDGQKMASALERMMASRTVGASIIRVTIQAG